MSDLRMDQLTWMLGTGAGCDIIHLLGEFSDALSSFALMIVSDSVTHLPKNLQFLTFYSSPTVPLGFFPGGINCLVTKVDWAGSVKQFLEMASGHSKQSKTKPNQITMVTSVSVVTQFQ